MPHGSHKAKMYSRHTKDKGIKAYHHGKSLNHKRKTAREEERKKETTKQPENN